MYNSTSKVESSLRSQLVRPTLTVHLYVRRSCWGRYLRGTCRQVSSQEHMEF